MVILLVIVITAYTFSTLRYFYMPARIEQRLEKVKSLFLELKHEKFTDENEYSQQLLSEMKKIDFQSDDFRVIMNKDGTIIYASYLSIVSQKTEKIDDDEVTGKHFSNAYNENWRHTWKLRESFENALNTDHGKTAFMHRKYIHYGYHFKIPDTNYIIFSSEVSKKSLVFNK